MEKRAEYIMKKAIQNIKEEFPPLIYALNLLKLKSTDSYILISTDKEYLLYYPEHVVREHRLLGIKGIQYAILHAVMHGLLGHWELDGHYGERNLLWLTMDREVGHLLEEMGYENKAVQDANEDIDELLGTCYDLGMYFRLRKDKKMARRFAKKDFHMLLQIDIHEFWRKKKEQQNEVSDANEMPELTAEEMKSNNDKDAGQNGAGDDDEKSKKWEKAREAFSGADGKVGGRSIAGVLKSAKQSRYQYGTGAGNVKAGVDAAKANDNSYYELLRQFLTNSKEQKATPEAIDYALYQYGLELYGDVPLLEPPDSEELLELNTICLAIDTSGSCSGEVANRFLRETYNLFRDLQSISTGGDLYLFQCDAMIQSEEYYERIVDLAEVMEKKKELYGFGGTSFTPVFERISNLEEEGKKIDCLIYFSDAEGDFPKTQPEYPVFFVLDKTEQEIKSDYWLRNNVPEWVTLVGMGKE